MLFLSASKEGFDTDFCISCFITIVKWGWGGVGWGGVGWGRGGVGGAGGGEGRTVNFESFEKLADKNIIKH